MLCLTKSAAPLNNDLSKTWVDLFTTSRENFLDDWDEEEEGELPTLYHGDWMSEEELQQGEVDQHPNIPAPIIIDDDDSVVEDNDINPIAIDDALDENQATEELDQNNINNNDEFIEDVPQGVRRNPRRQARDHPHGIVERAIHTLYDFRP
jgi:hypothetical protein